MASFKVSRLRFAAAGAKTAPSLTALAVLLSAELMGSSAANATAACSSSAMRVLRIVPAGVTHPFGDERTVSQAFPAGIAAEEADPFLMCDHYKRVSSGVASHEDDFPVDWHPHRGMDILTYMKSGVGRHADSMGNRCSFPTPGMQWTSCGSGIEHAEDGATPKGDVREGFQIWVNVPAARKMDDPRYGTVPPEEIGQIELAPGAHARLLAGPLGDRAGPFATVAPVQMVDFELGPNASLVHAIPTGHDSAMLFVYRGGGRLLGGGEEEIISAEEVALLDASSDDVRDIELVGAEGTGMSALLFSGRRLREPIVWHGPIVMNSQQQVRQTLAEVRRGTFPPKRVPWDYKRAAAAPK